ncbi:MAG: 4'-phosphopantetheinyl transferase superfamily protein [Bacteroidota bacterium]
MIGIDIVDLAQAEKDSNWKRSGYLNKLFTTEEQFMISSDIQPDILVWLLWTMKEAAYKIHSNHNKLREFAPVKLVCSNLIIYDDTATGNVSYNDQLYFTKSIIAGDYIHSISAQTKQELETVHIEILPNSNGNRPGNPTSVSHHGRFLALAYA